MRPASGLVGPWSHRVSTVSAALTSAVDRNGGGGFQELHFDLQLVGRRLPAASVDDDLIGNLLPLREPTKPRAFYRADVNENIRSTGIRLDETKTLLRVELLYDTGLHDFAFPEAQVFCRPRRGDRMLIEALERKSHTTGAKRRASWFVRPKLDVALIRCWTRKTTGRSGSRWADAPAVRTFDLHAVKATHAPIFAPISPTRLRASHY